MKPFLLISALALLAACGERQSLETYTCPNGPDLAVVYDDEGATLRFASGRVETLAATETENIYAKPGIVWDTVAFRTARLTDGQTSYLCDQMAG